MIQISPLIYSSQADLNFLKVKQTLLSFLLALKSLETGIQSLLDLELEAIIAGDFIFQTRHRENRSSSTSSDMRKSIAKFIQLAKEEKWPDRCPIFPGHGSKNKYYDELENNPYTSDTNYL